MKPIPDEKKIEEMLANSSPRISSRLDRYLSNAPWTERAVARRRFVSAASFFILLLALFVAITPQGRAFAQNILRLFIRATGDTISVPTQPITWVEVTPGIPHPSMSPMPTLTPLVAFAEDCGSFPIMSCSVEEIRSKVDFIVKEPAHIPPEMYFTGATGGPDEVYLRYEYENNSGGLFISQERWMGIPDEGMPRIGASAVVEDVEINDQGGQYFKGSFVQRSGEAGAKWDPNFQAETLRWVDDDISYTLVYDYTTQGPLGKEGLVAIAESMTTKPVAKLPMPITPTVTAPVAADPNLMAHKIALAERQAGFKLMLPPRLPAEVASHGGASYNPATGVVSVWFTYDDAYMNGLYLDQQTVTNPEDCVLCDAVLGDDNSALLTHGPEVVSASANLQTVQIGDVAGKYYEGVRLGSGEWEADPEIKHLRWQVNGRAFELVSLGTDLQKEDLIAVAESLTIPTPTPTPTPDGAERWDPRVFWNLSLSEAEEQAGYKLILPSILPEVLQYFAAHYDDQGKVVWVHYEMDEGLMGPNDNGLVVLQQVIADPSQCDLCDILVGDINLLKDRSHYLWIVAPEANLETVQIGDVTAKYVEGNWEGTDCCGWVWRPDPFFKVLRWQKNGRAFELSYMGEEIHKEDMIRIAESMN